MELYQKIQQSISYIKEQAGQQAEVAVILGTGLGKRFLESVEIETSLQYKDIPHFPDATMEYHQGVLHFAHYRGKKLMIFQGRFHYYEGLDMGTITYPVRIAKEMGVQFLLLSNAAGCINLDWNKGELMLIEDHINLQPENPLRGINDSRLGPRFVDMSAPYSKEINNALNLYASALQITLREGVYAAVSGPNLETRAEYRYLKIIGADAVGMSTVPEVIVANQVGLPCAAISVLTDTCDPDHLEPVNIPEILSLAEKAEKPLTELFLKLIEEY